MLFDFNSKSSLLFVFFLHGLIFSCLLLVKGIQSNDKPSYWLSLFTFLCTLYISPFMLGYAGWYTENPYRDILFYIPFQQLLLLPPILYFYCKSLFDRTFTFRKVDYFHFLPAFLYLLYSLSIFLMDKVILKEAYFYEDGRDKDFIFEYQLAGFVSLVLYLILSLKSYKTYRNITYDTISYADSITFKWAQRFLIAFLGLLIFRGLFFILNPEWAEFGRKFWYYLVFSILFYYISLSGYLNSIRSVTSFLETSPDQKRILPPTESSNSEKVEVQDLEIWKEKIDRLMRIERIYENPELSIFEISQKLDTHSKKISQVINQGYDMNFNDFINQYRVKAVIKKMEAGEHTIQTLLGLALEVGFNSKSTFNRAFKRHTSRSPNDYIKENFQ
ncbi:AraC-like DNA-binding protein [Algoriphagus iocasae]|jgi:AraC-like DNA-binding protein|uniref:AraC-like DNA-binding protein n=1 Tax=Algoriphagus iocasae TaxID=1836499 RepID=A0A841MX32_9BACT|nr:AraC family transcriptional regulator [Algoriphagus iocasae]MBB6326571.1 AraC-like DNA-binding protein [Algoriphagus iocasae]